MDVDRPARGPVDLGEERLLCCPPGRGLAPAAPRCGASPVGSSLRARHLSRRPGLSVLDQRRDALAERRSGRASGHPRPWRDSASPSSATLRRRCFSSRSTRLRVWRTRVLVLRRALAPRRSNLFSSRSDPRADALQLALGARARGERLDDLVDPVGDRQRHADGNVDGPLGGLARVGGAAVTSLRQALANRRAVAATARSRSWLRLVVVLRLLRGGPGLGVAVGCHLFFESPRVGLVALDLLISKVVRV